MQTKWRRHDAGRVRIARNFEGEEAQFFRRCPQRFIAQIEFATDPDDISRH